MKLHTLGIITTILMLLSAGCSCSGGGGGGGDSSGPVPILSLTSSTLTFDEDFATVQLIATATNASEITINPTSTDLIIVETTSNTVHVSSVLNANGQTTLTITATNGGGSVSTDVLVIVNAINDAPTLSVSNTALTLIEDFATTASITLSTNDVEGSTLTISVAQSTSGVVNAVATTNAIDLTSIANANGRTTLTITVNDGALSASAQVGVIVNAVVDTPTISIQIANLNENEDFLGFRTVATLINVDADTLTVSVTQSTPEVVTVTTSATSVRVSNIAQANGQSTLTISANNRGIQVSTQVNVVVNAVNDTPTLTIATSLLTFSEDLVVASTIAAFTDIDGDTLTISVTQSTPEVVTVTTAASGVRISNLANANGRSTLTIQVNDDTTNASTQVVVVVSSVNDTPILSVSTNDITLIEDFATTIPITVTATDTDGDTLTISVTQSTLGVVTAVATSNAVNVSSILNVYGRTTLTITLSDGTTSTSTQVAVTVTPLNDPPILAVSINRLMLIEDFINVVPIAVLRGDIDGDTLTLSVSESSTGVINATTTTIGVDVSRIDNANGRTTLTINIFDGTINVSTEVVVIVDEVNDSPNLNVSTNALALTEDFATTQTIVILSSDIDNDPLTISVTQSTLGVVTAVATSNAVNVSSILNANGRTTLTISLSDGTTSTSTQVAITVNAVNDTPTFSTFANPLTLIEDFADATTIVTVTDVENSSLIFSVIESTTGVIDVTTSTSAVRISNIAHANGQTTLTITVVDGAINVSTQVTVTVISVNDTPTFSVSTTVLTFDEDFETIVPIDVPRNDVDGDTLTLSFTESTTGVVSVTTSVTGLRVSRINNANGRTTLTININDGEINVSTQVTVTVNAINDTPTLTLSTARLTLSEDFETTILITVSANDIEGDTLTISLLDFISGVVNTVRTTTGFEVSSITNANGVTVLTIWVSDGMSTNSIAIPVSVMSVNDTPTLTVPTNTLTFSEDFIGTSTIATASDVDRTDFVRLSVIQSTPEVVVVTTSAAGVQISNLSNAFGRTTLNITASDGVLNTSTEVIVFVNSVNDTPTLSLSTTALTLVEDFATTIPITITMGDMDGDTLTLSVTESSTGVITVTTSASEIGVSSIANANGVTTLTVTLNDGTIDVITQVVVQVISVPDTPTITVFANPLILDEEFSVTTVATAIDVDGETLTFSVTESTTGVINITTSAIGVQVSNIANANGRTTLTLSVSNSMRTASTQVVVIVNAVNDTPTLSISTTVITLNEDFATTETIVVTIRDVENSSLTYSIIESTTGVIKVTTSTSEISISNIAHANGQTTLTITVVDGVINVSTQVAVTVISVNDTPTFSVSTTVLTFNEDFETIVPIDVPRNDVDGDTLTLSFTESTTGVVSVTTSVTGLRVSRINNANGRTTLTININDGKINVSTQVTVTVNAINDTPTLTISTTNLTFSEDFETTILITVSANDTEGDTLTISLLDFISGVVNTVRTTTGFEVSSIANANGVTVLTILVSDGLSTASNSVAVSVMSVNDTPTLTVPTNTLSFSEDFIGTSTIATASDVDRTDFVRFSVIQSTPEVVVVTTSAAGVQISNLSNAFGRTTLTITASDGVLNTSTEVTVFVNSVNDTPTLSLSTTALTLVEDFATTIPITITMGDMDGDTLTLSVTESSTGVITVTTSASEIGVSSIANANGVTTLTVTLNDGTIDVITQVVVQVISVPDTPTITVFANPLVLIENFGVSTVATAIDVDGETLTFSVTESTTGVINISTSATGVQVSNIANANGRTTLTLSVSNSMRTASTQVVVIVNAVNDTPTLSISTTVITLNEDFATTETIVVTIRDVENSSLTYSIIESTTGVIKVTTSTSEISISNIAHANGQTTLTITVVDGAINVSTQVAVTVISVNDTPTFSVSTTVLTFNEDFETIVPIDVPRNDVDGDTLTLSFTESTTGVVSVTTSVTGLRVSRINNANGRTTLTININDGKINVSTQVTVTVNAINDTPTLTISTTNLTFSEDFETTILITVSANDTEGDTLTISLLDFISGVVNTVRTTTGFEVSSIANANGVTVLTILVSDGLSTASNSVAVSVMSVNDTPTLTVPTNTLSFSEDFIGTSTIATASDVDRTDFVRFSVIQSTPEVVVVTTSAAGVQISNLSNAFGRTTLTITASDGVLNTSTEVTVFVNSVNDTPTLSLSTTALTLVEDFATTIPITITMGDMDGDTLTLSVTESSTGVITVTTSASEIGVSSIANANGVTTLTVTLNDGTIDVITQVVVKVISVPEAPTITVFANPLILNEEFGVTTVATAIDVDGDTVTLSVVQSTTGVVTFTTSNAIVKISSIANAFGRSTLTISATDGTLTATTQVVAIVNPVNDTPTINVLPRALTLDEDFATTQTIALTLSDLDNDTLTYSVAESTTGLIKVTTAASEIRLSSIANANGRTTLTITVRDSSLSSTAVVTVTINAVNDPVLLALSSSVITLSAIGDQLDRIVQDISISNVDKIALSIQVFSSGNAIFSTNPTPLVSFTTNALTTITTQNSVVSTAQLYFSIAPNQSGTATLTVHLSSPSRPDTTQQTMVVQVVPVDALPVIIKNSTNLENFVVHGGHLYARSVVPGRPIAPFLAEAQRSGGHLINFNTIEELNFVNAPASGFVFSNPWVGMHVPNITFPGELYWVTNDSTIAYGFAIANAGNNPTVYPGHYALPWNFGSGLVANRGSSRPFSTSNWPVYSNILKTFFLLGNTGDTTPRHALFEFPTGVASAPLKTVIIGEGTSIIARLTGFDLNGDTINISDWSGVDPSSGTVNIRSITQRSGAHTVDVEYMTPPNFSGVTTVVITLQVNGSTVSANIPVNVDEAPVIALSTNAITLAEDFSSVVIGTTATDLGVIGTLPFTASASPSGIVNITTSANVIQLSSVLNANGVVTLTVQATDSAPQTVTTLVVVTVQAVNDTPTINISTVDITTLGGFAPINIDFTISDVEDNFSSLSITLNDSNPGVVNAARVGTMIVVSPIRTGLGRTTLTLSATDLGNKTGIQTIALNVLVRPATTPVLTVSTNNIVLHEDFADFVINTTETDDSPESLSVSVSAFNTVVNAVVSARRITLRSINNIFGPTTLTVRLSDQDGLFDLEEIVVDVLPVNDTPVITVSTAVIYIETTPVILTISVDDVENGSLPFSFSTNHSQINSVINNSELTITRLGLPIAQYMLTINTVDLDGLRSSTLVTVVLPPILILSTGIKTINYNWSSIPSATHYFLQSNIDRLSGYADLTTKGVVVNPNSTNIRQTSAHANVALHRYIPIANNPLYGVGTCDTSSCGASFRHSLADMTNIELQALIGRFEASNSAGSSQFGESVSISGDGNTLAVGAIGDDSSSTGINSVPTNNNSNSGAVYIFRRNGGTWTQQAYIKASNADPNDNFGRSVSLSADGNTLAVGVPFEASLLTGINVAQNNNSGFQAGAVYLFRFNASTNSWLQQAYIKAANAGIPDRFGLSVAISDDGNTLAVGAPLEGSSSMGVNGPQNDGSPFSGAAYIFRFSSSTNAWFQQAFVKASNTGGSDNFGISVSLNADGNTLAVGASSEAGISNNVLGSGAAYVFRSDGSNWSQQAYLKATNAGIGDGFGLSLSLNDNGNTLAVSAPNEDSSSTGINSVPNNNTTNTGAVYVFQFNPSGVWTQQAYIKASNPDEEDVFGGSVSLSKDGSALVVGATNEDGSSTGVAVIDNNARPNAGAAYMFEFRNGQWEQQAYIKSISPDDDDRFGSSVSISNSGNTIAVGAENVGNTEGQVYLY